MFENELLDHVRRTSRNRAILAVLVFLATITVLALNAKYLLDSWRGPTDVTPQTLASVQSPESLPRQWVNVSVARIEDTGIEEITVRKKRGMERSRSRSARYFVARVGNKLLLVKVRGDTAPGRDLTGEILPLELGVVDSLLAGTPGAQLRDLFLPVELDTHDYSANAKLIAWITSLALAGAALYGGLAWRRYSQPEYHPAIKRARQWGHLESVTQAVTRDQLQAVKVGDWQLGERYALLASSLKFDLHNLDELLWAYTEVIKKKMYYIIPAGQSHAVVLKWRDHVVRAEMPEDQTLITLARIKQNQPWVLSGWSDEAEKMYALQRATLASEVNQRRKQHAQTPAPTAQPDPDYLPTRPLELRG